MCRCDRDSRSLFSIEFGFVVPTFCSAVPFPSFRFSPFVSGLSNAICRNACCLFTLNALSFILAHISPSILLSFAFSTMDEKMPQSIERVSRSNSRAGDSTPLSGNTSRSGLPKYSPAQLAALPPKVIRAAVLH